VSAISRNERLWNIEQVVPRSVNFSTGKLDHLGPLLGFGSNVLAEISGWATERCSAEVGKPRLDRGIGEARVDLFVKRSFLVSIKIMMILSVKQLTHLSRLAPLKSGQG